jgi:chaperonin GroES
LSAKISAKALAPDARLAYVQTASGLALASLDCQFSETLQHLQKLKEDCMKFRPLHDRVVVKRLDAEEKTKGGIIIPDTAKEKPSQGEITAVGPGGRDEAGKLIPIDLKVGDRVLFGKWSGTEVTIDGEDLLIMKESDIMGVLTDFPAAKKKAA